jgi:uroporphyrinogen III methyltransferase/synthase
MGVAELEDNVARLLAAGMAPKTPAVAIERGTFPTQRTLRATLSTLVQVVRDQKLKPPALFIIGESVEQRDTIHWFEDRPLFGLRIMVIRPAHQARPLYTDLRNLGAEVLPYPTIATHDDFDAETWEKIQRLTTSNRWLTLGSENGVRCFLAQWQKVVGDIRGLARFNIAAVGQGTLRALQQHGLAPDFVPSPGTSGALVEQLVLRPDFAGATVVRVRGNLESDRVETELTAAGAKVLPLCVYRTTNRTWSGSAREKLFAHPPEVMIVTSGTSVDGLVANLSEADLKHLTASTVVASIGPTTSRRLETLGFRVAIEAKKHTIPALLDALLSYHVTTPIARLS